MAKYPNPIKEREELNLRLGIKSSLSHLRNVIASLYCLYVAADKSSHIIYAEEHDKDGNKALELTSSLAEAIKRNFDLHPDAVSLVSSSPLFTSQIEALQVGLELFFHLAKVNLVESGLSERTGRSRYQKEIFFSTNMLQLDVVLSCYDKVEVESFLVNWLNEKKHESKLENDILLLLSIFSEDTQCKIRTTEGKEIYFQREGIYEVLKDGSDVISEDAKELVGPYRILKSYIGSGMHPYLNDVSKTFQGNLMHNAQFQTYAEMVSTMLDLTPHRQTIIQEELLEKVSDFESVYHGKLPLQQIYYGAPGTGKSHAINELTEGESVIRTTFHPDSDYSTFVGAYKPTMGLLPICDELGQPMKIGSTVLHKEQIIYEFVDQAFLQAYVKAWKHLVFNEGKKQYLVIEEINRGNCAQIFGDLFQLLDRNAAGFSDYPINADKDMQKFLKKAFARTDEPDKQMFLQDADKQRINKLYKGGEDVVSKVFAGEILVLPDNLYIWATMNTSDQSLFPIDSAFKRRWEWQYMPIDRGYDANGQEIKWAIEGATQKFDWWSFLEKINAQIGEATQSEDKKLGFFFCKASDGVISAEKFVGKVIFYLWNDVFKNNGFEGPIFKDVDGTELSFSKFYKSDYKGNAIVQKDKVEVFLINLGVDELDDLLSTDSDGNDTVGMSVFYNGEVIHEKNDLETYVKTLEKIGVDKIEPLKIKCHNQFVVGIEPPGNYAWRTVNDYKILTFKLHQHMERILNEIAAGLHLDMKVSFA